MDDLLGLSFIALAALFAIWNSICLFH